jgi:cysteine-rich repeat protein
VDASCGDGFVHAGVEECDDGTANSDTTPDACRTTCLSAHCGDTVTDTGEECDDGNTTAGDGCENDCTETCIPTLYSYSRATTSETAPTTLNTTSKTDASLLTAIGLTGVGQVTAASFDTTTGRLFASHGGGGCCPVSGYTACLMETDITTGATTVVGCDPTYGGLDNMPGLAVDSAGNIYGMLLADNAGLADGDVHLVSVDKTTGAITVIGRTAVWWPAAHGIAFGPGDVLYYHNDGDGFGTIDLTTGAFTAIGESFVGFPSMTFSRVTDMAYDGVAGVMYASVSYDRGYSALASVDLTTGTFTYLGTFPEQSASIAIPCH